MVLHFDKKKETIGKLHKHKVAINCRFRIDLSYFAVDVFGPFHF